MDFEKVLENEPVKVLNKVIAMQIKYLDEVADCEIREKEIILNKVARDTVPKYPAKAKSDLVYINNKSI